MADPGNTHYRIKGLNRAFALSSLALLGSTVWAVLADWSREWKTWQRAYQTEEADRAERAIAAVETPEFRAETERLQREIDEAAAALRDRAAELKPLETSLDKVTGDEYAADQDYRIARAEQQVVLWRVQEERVHRDDPNHGGDELLAAETRVRNTRGAWEKLAAEKEVAAAKVAEAKKAWTSASNTLSALEQHKAPLRQTIEQVRPSTVSGKALRAIRDFPGLDFLAPSLKVEKTVLDDLWFDLNFPGTRKRRVDMCQTCHLPVDKAGWEAPDAKFPDSPAGKQPLKTHPRLDLFLSASSPHPKEKFGCTICHRGSGEALEFVRADHNPGDDAERARWVAERHWHKMHHWDFPMHPTPVLEAGCVQCHKDTLDLIGPDAPTLSRGLELFERSGCYSCHKLSWFPVTRRPGPPLAKLPSKTSAEWAAAWIANPKAFRPKSPMPRFFHLENAVSKAWDDNLIAAAAHYVFSNATAADLPAPPAGNAERGRELVTTRGCLGCHELADVEGSGHAWSDFGPALDGVGSKLRPEWIFAWVRDPKGMWPETRMPDLRLTPEEGADVTAFLASLTEAPAAFRPGVPAVDRAELQRQAKIFVESSAPIARAERVSEGLAAKDEAVLAELRSESGLKLASGDPLLEFVGFKFIQRQGCYSCHEIPGFERAQPIGVELTEWASKNFEQLDFGFLGRDDVWGRWKLAKSARSEAVVAAIDSRSRLPATRHDWIAQKLRAPRSYDFEKGRAPLDLFRMPQFDFKEEEIRAISTFVLGFVKDEVPVAMKHRPAAREQAMQAGLASIRRNNCSGCHVFKMEEVAFRTPSGEEVAALGRTSLDDADAKEIYFELWEPAPGLGKTSEKLQIPYASIVSRRPADGGGILPSLAAHFAEKNGWAADDAKNFVLSPPFLVGEGSKVQAPWLFSFLKKPVTLRPWLEVRMPTFGFSDAEARALAEHFAAVEDRNHGRAYSRELRAALGDLSVEALGREAKVAGTAEQASRMVAALEAGRRGAGDALKKLQAFAAAKSVSIPGPPGLPFEHVLERDDAYLEAKNRAIPNYLSGAARISGEEGFNCFKCHYRGLERPPGDDPLAHAPDLSRAKDRLRPDWIRAWLKDAQRIYPGTSMPTFGTQKPGYPALLGGPDVPIETQLEAVKDYLMNLDRAPQAKTASG